MKRRIFALILTVAMVLSLFSVTAFAKTISIEEELGTTRTSVTSGGIYTISSQQELAYLSTLVESGVTCDGATFVLTKDIAITNDYDPDSNGNFTPIGNITYQFNGTFDGQYFTVSGLNINSSNSGLFGNTGSNAVIRNVNVSGSVAGTGIGLAGVVGTNYGTVLNCSSSVTVNATGSIGAGGIAGMNYGTVQNCYNTGSVSGSQMMGGIVGNNSGTVQNCYNTGNITGTFYIAGIVGDNSGTVQNCYNIGSISGSSFDGGICGCNFSTIQNCYWLSSSANASIGAGTGINVVNFTNTSGGTLNIAVGGETSLLAVLNAGVTTYQTTPASLIPWIAGTTYPVFKAPTEAPAFSSTTFYMPDTTATTINFTLTNAINGATYRLYSTRLGGSATATVTNHSGTTLSFTLSSAPTNGTKYYISAEDVNGSITESIRTKVNVVYATPPSITTTTPPNGTVNITYSQNLTATGDTPITWSVTSGSLPAGLNLSSDGTISGTPTMAGTYNFTVKAENAGGSDTKAYTIIINNITITNIPQSYTMYTGGRVTFDPTPSGGTWNWDESYFSATFNSPATFTALKSGTSTITYTVNGVTQSIKVTVLASTLPQAGQDSTMIYVLALLSTLCAAVAGVLYLKTRIIKNHGSK